MMTSWRLRILVSVALLHTIAYAAPVQYDRFYHIVVLYSHDGSAAPYDRIGEIFATELQQRWDAPVTFDEIDLDKRWSNVFGSDAASVAMIGHRWGTQPPDLVVALGPPAIRFWLQYRESMQSDAPVIAVAREGSFERDALKSRDVGIWTEFSFLPMVDNILELKPDTDRIIFVFGNSLYERALSDLARTQLAELGGQLRFEFTDGATLQEIQTIAAGAAGNAAIFYGILNVDAAGIILHHLSGLSAVRTVSNAPVFGAFDQQIGSGIVGGRLIQVENIAREVALAAEEILLARHNYGRWRVFPLSEPVYDWRELQRWSIDPDNLPAGSTIHFRPESILEQYATWIATAVSVVILQSLLIVSLLAQRSRRKEAEQVQARLAGQLISAQEDERRLIARELHDDLSQRLARAALDAAWVAEKSTATGADETLESLRKELKSVSRDVHNMSYRLHPAVLEDLGLATALKLECDQIAQHTSAAIDTRIGDVPKSLTPEQNLCIYRIAQEAMHNAVRHADATRISVSLEEKSGGLVATVTDDGIGFDTSPRSPGAGLGMSSMTERAKLAGGELSIRSQFGRGTTIRAAIPTTG